MQQPRLPCLHGSAITWPPAPGVHAADQLDGVNDAAPHMRQGNLKTACTQLVLRSECSTMYDTCVTLMSTVGLRSYAHSQPCNLKAVWLSAT